MTTKEQIQRLARELVRLVALVVKLKKGRDDAAIAYADLSSQLQASIDRESALSLNLSTALDEKVTLSLKLDESNAQLIEALSNDKADADAIAAAVKATEEQQAITASLIQNVTEVTNTLAAKSAESDDLKTSLAAAVTAAAVTAADAVALEEAEAAELQALVEQLGAVVE